MQARRTFLRKCRKTYVLQHFSSVHVHTCHMGIFICCYCCIIWYFRYVYSKFNNVQNMCWKYCLKSKRQWLLMSWPVLQSILSKLWELFHHNLTLGAECFIRKHIFLSENFIELCLPVCWQIVSPWGNRLESCGHFEKESLIRVC